MQPPLHFFARQPHRRVVGPILGALLLASALSLIACAAESATGQFDPTELSPEEQKETMTTRGPDLCAALGLCLGVGAETMASCPMALSELPLLDALCDLDECAGWLASSACDLSLLSTPLDACACLDLTTLLGTLEGVLGPILLAGGTIQELLGIGLSLHQLLAGGLSIEQLLGGGVPILDLLGAGLSITDLLGAGLSITDLLSGGVPILDLLGAGLSITDLLGAGLSVTELLDAGLSVGDLLAGGVGLIELLLGGITESELLAAGVPLADIVAALLSLGR